MTKITTTMENKVTGPPLQTVQFEDIEIGMEETVVEDADDEEEEEEEEENTTVTESGWSHSESSTESEGDGTGMKYSKNFMHYPYGFQLRASYEHQKRMTDLAGVIYNSPLKRYMILDMKGITSWARGAVECHRKLQYCSFEYRNITQFSFSKKHNVYFTLNKDFSLKVLNKNFKELYREPSDKHSVLFMTYNLKKDELLTCGVGGVKVFQYAQTAKPSMAGAEMEMSNWKLVFKYELDIPENVWVKRLYFDNDVKHLYACCDTDLYGYSTEDNHKLLFKFIGAHRMAITGAVYSSKHRAIVTGSLDTTVRVWSVQGGLLHTFTGHARPISAVVRHPNSSSLIITSSLDGSVRMWSLDTMDCLYSLTMSTEGVIWMNLTDDEGLLYLGTLRSVFVYSLNYISGFWGLTRGRVDRLWRQGGIRGKSTRILALQEEGSTRIFSRGPRKNLVTMLPAPALSPLRRLLAVAYSRLTGTAVVLLDSRALYLYTARTDPACLATIWDVLQLQEEDAAAREALKRKSQVNMIATAASKSQRHSIGGVIHRATEHGSGQEIASPCSTIAFLEDAHVQMLTEEGYACPINDIYLLLGLEDGRILFMDATVRGKKYFEFKANKDKIKKIVHDRENKTLMTHTVIGGISHIQLWSLPQLALIHEVLAPVDVTCFARIGSTLVTGHESGSLYSHHLVPATEHTSPFKMKLAVIAEKFATQALHKKHEHNGPIMAMDVCFALQIFLTASPEGSVKVWQEGKVCMTEITLDETLSAACFLNNLGDIVVGFQNHIYRIDHKRVCPSLYDRGRHNDEDDDKESAILEDPYVVYEGVSQDTTEMDMERYLVPFDMKVAEEFLAAQKSGAATGEAEESSESESESWSMVPTEIYLSPKETPRRLSLVDLTLGTEVTNKDVEDTRVRVGSPKFKEFEFPKFGKSPGPTPRDSSGSETEEQKDATPVPSDAEDDGLTLRLEVDTDSREVLFYPRLESEPPPPPDQKKKFERRVSSFSDKLTMKERLKNISIDSSQILKQQSSKNMAAVKKASAEANMAKIRESNMPEKKQQKRQPRERKLRQPLTEAERKRPKDVTSNKSVGLRSLFWPKKAALRPTEITLEGSGAEPGEPGEPGGAEPPELPVMPKPKRRETAAKGQAIFIGGPPQRPRSATVKLSDTEESGESGSDEGVTGVGSDAEFLDTPAGQLVTISEGSGIKSRPTTGGSRLTVQSADSSKSPIDRNRSPSDRAKSPGTALGRKSPFGRRQLRSMFDGPLGLSVGVTPWTPLSDDDDGAGSEWTMKDPDDIRRELEDIDDLDEEGRRIGGGRLGETKSETALPEYGSRDFNRFAYPYQSADRMDHTYDPEAKALETWTKIDIINQLQEKFIEERAVQGTRDEHIQLRRQFLQQLEAEFHTLLAKYKGFPGASADDGSANSLNKTASMKFGDEYFENLIERHYLIRMQKELREQGARQKRIHMEREKRDKILAARKSPRMQSRASIPKQGQSPTDAPPPSPAPPPSSSLSFRSHSAVPSGSTRGSRRLQGPSQGAWSTEVIWSSEGDSQGTRSRSAKERSPGHRLQEARAQTSLGLAPSQYTHGGSRKPTSGAHPPARYNIDAALKQEKKAERKELSKQQAFRMRMEDRGGPPVFNGPPEDVVRMLDPRHPASRAFRPVSASIPSKCARYVLISHQHTKQMLPSTLEETLIPERFPGKWEDKWLGPHPHPSLSRLKMRTFPQSYSPTKVNQ